MGVVSRVWPSILALLGVVAAAEEPKATQDVGKSTNIRLHEGISREDKWTSVGHKGVTLWMTGLSGSGKSTISVALEHALVAAQDRPYFVYRLDGDNLRFGLNSDLGFSPEHRKENVRRVAEVSKLFAEAGAVTIAGLISPYAADRQLARELHVNASLPFMEVFVDAPLNVVEQRDPKGLYKKARKGIIKNFTGLDAPYEKPENPEVHVRTDIHSIEECVNQILAQLDKVGLSQSKVKPLCERSSCPAAAKGLGLWSTIKRMGTEDPRMSQVVVHGNVVYLAGQLDMAASDIKGQTANALAKIDSLLASAGTSKSRLLTASIWLKNIERDFETMNSVWTAWLDPANKPVRVTTQASLAFPSLLVEVQVTAAVE